MWDTETSTTKGNDMKRTTLAASFASSVALVVVALATPARAEDKAARISAFDVLARTGKATKLRAKIEGKGMLGVYSGLEGENLDFYEVAEPAPGGKPGTQTLEKSKFVGSARTDASGVGELEWTPEAQGSYELEVQVRKGSAYTAVPAPLALLVAARDKPIAIVTIEHTLTEFSATNFMRKDAKDVAASPGAPEALAKLAEAHHLVYLTGIEEVSLVKTKDWLRLRGFPTGPVFFWNISTQSLSGEKYKTEAVNKLHADFASLTIGVGGRDEDVAAFYANGVTAYCVSTSMAEAGQAIVLKSWDKLPQAVARQHEVEALLADLASKDKAKQDEAAKAFTRLETPAVSYLWRFFRATDVSLAAAARLVNGRVRARDAFVATLDMKGSDSTALASLVAAWRSGDPVISSRLYKEGATGLAKSGPPAEAWRGIEVVNRSEPEPGKVLYRIRFLPEKEGATGIEKDFVFVRADDGSWCVDSGDL